MKEINVGELKIGYKKDFTLEIPELIGVRVKVIPSCNCTNSSYDNKKGILYITIKPNDIPIHLIDKIDKIPIEQSVSIYWNTGEDKIESINIRINGTAIK